MPLYEYQCDSCGRRVEVIVKFSDPPLDKCPSCGGPVHKLFSSPAIQFKGTGFYITDYGKKDQATAEQPSESKSDTSSKERDKGERGDKSEKGERSDKGEKTEKTEKTEKSEKSEKSESKSEKTESKPAASTAGESAPAKPKEST